MVVASGRVSACKVLKVGGGALQKRGVPAESCLCRACRLHGPLSAKLGCIHSSQQGPEINTIFFDMNKKFRPYLPIVLS